MIFYAKWQILPIANWHWFKMPTQEQGSVSIAAFHDRKDMDEVFCFLCFRNDLLDTVIFAESIKFADELNSNSVFPK